MDFLSPVHLLYRPVITGENIFYNFSWTVLPLVHYLHEGTTQSQLKSGWPWSFHGPLLQPPKKTQQDWRLRDGLETHPELTEQHATVKRWDSLPRHALEAKCSGELQEGLHRFAEEQSIHGYRTCLFRHSFQVRKKKISLIQWLLEVRSAHQRRDYFTLTLFCFVFLIGICYWH